MGQKKTQLQGFVSLLFVFGYKHAMRRLVFFFKGENGGEGPEGLPGWPGSLVSP